MYAGTFDSLPHENDSAVNVDELWRRTYALAHEYVVENEPPVVLERIHTARSTLQKTALLAAMLQNDVLAEQDETWLPHRGQVIALIAQLLGELDLLVVFGNRAVLKAFYSLLEAYTETSQDTGSLLVEIVRRVGDTASLNATLYYLHHITLKHLYSRKSYREIASLEPLFARHTAIDPLKLNREDVFESYYALAMSLMNTGHYQAAHRQFQILFKLPVCRTQPAIQSLVAAYTANLVLVGLTKDANLLKYGGYVSPACCQLIQSYQTCQPTSFSQTVDKLAEETHELVTQVFRDLKTQMRTRILQLSLEPYSRVGLETVRTIDPLDDVAPLLERLGYVVDAGLVQVPSTGRREPVDTAALVAAIKSLDRITAKTTQSAQLKEAQELRKQRNLSVYHQTGRVDGNAEPPVVHRGAVGELVAVLENIDERNVNDGTVVEAVNCPRPENLHVEEMARLADLVELRILVQHVGCDVLVEDTDHERRKHKEYHVVQREGPRLHHRLAAEPVAENVPELCHVLELADRKVCAARCLHAFHAADADANVRGLDHRHVVGTVSDRQKQRTLLALHEPHHKRFLQRRHTAADHRLAENSDFQQQVLKIGLQSKAQRLAVDHERQRVDVVLRQLVAAQNLHFVEQVLFRVPFALLVHNEQVHVLAQQFAAHSNVYGRLLTVARQHPHLDAGLLQQSQKLVDDFSVSVLFAVDLQLLERMVADLNAALDAGLAVLRDLADVAPAADGTCLELHDVSGQRARFVAENVLDLAKLLDKRRRANHCWRVGRLVVHVEIRSYEICLVIFDDLDGDKQRDRDEVREKHPVRQDVGEKQLHFARAFQIEVAQMVFHERNVENVAERRNHRQHQQNAKQRDHLQIDDALDVGLFDRRRRRVAHQLCLVARENHNSLDPDRVAQIGAAQKQLVWAQRDLAPVQVQRTLVRVQTAVGPLAQDFPLALDQLLRRHQPGSLLARLLDFQVGFAVQVRRLDVAQPFRLGRAQQNQVRRKRLLAVHLDNVADPDVDPFFHHVLPRLDVQHLYLGPVQLVVGRVSLDILRNLLNGGNQQHHHQRADRGVSVGRRHRRDLLDHRREQEKQVCVLGKLLKQKLGHKRDEVVLGGADVVVVVAEPCVCLRIVDVDRPRARVVGAAVLAEEPADVKHVEGVRGCFWGWRAARRLVRVVHVVVRRSSHFASYMTHHGAQAAAGAWRAVIVAVVVAQNVRVERVVVQRPGRVVVVCHVGKRGGRFGGPWRRVAERVVHAVQVNKVDKIVAGVNLDPVLSRHVVGNFSSVGLGVHDQTLQILDVLHQESLVAGRHHVSGLLVGSITDLWLSDGASESSSDTGVDTLLFSPVLGHSVGVKLRKSYKNHIADLPGKHAIPTERTLSPIVFRPENPDLGDFQLKQYPLEQLKSLFSFEKSSVNGVPGFDSSKLAIDSFDSSAKKERKRKGTPTTPSEPDQKIRHVQVHFS
ncbi:hypothetical protein OGATHE_004070 [Ogataea polymorpha]|uniref:Mediator of RNA polymerase II transcription subunit 19 n=1 Tax=Ogataea polymorpha TaxID=460523 RepID=A0A9P8T4N4_9ASCO|nr:hypothetical protein OGATHE_004070 [Ogataea polymorpha]